jgi:hypothetical protein
MKPPFAVRLMLCVPWCLILVALAVAGVIDWAINWAADKLKGPPD